MSREVGDKGQCEAHDMIRTEDDAIDVRCPRLGTCIRETDEFGKRPRLRFVCGVHGYDSAMTVN